MIAEEAQRAEIETKFALGEEDSDERSTRHSTSEETGTDVENQEHPAAVLTSFDHLSTSPAKTRFRTLSLKPHTAAMVASAQPGISNVVSILLCT